MKYKVRDGCPHCGRRPNVRFSEREVRRCKTDRAAARHTEVQCQRCQRRYWIFARQIADATRDGRTNGNGNGGFPDGFPEADRLEKLGLTSLEELRELESVQDLPGFGPARAGRVQKALDAQTQGAVP